MSIEELIKKDNTFSETTLLSKADNTFIMLLSSIMMWDMNRVKHKISDNLFNKYNGIVEDLKNKNQRRMFDEMNVKTSNITSISEDDNYYIVNVLLVSRYMDYYVDATTMKYISGINDHRVEKNHNLIFKKRKNAKVERIAARCPGCGAPADVNNTGVCSYCGAIFNTDDYDWILDDIN